MKHRSALIRAAATLAVLVATVALAAGADPREAGPAKPPTDTSLPIRVNNPRRLGAWQLPAERVALGEGYKPSLALLPGGDLVLVALFQEPRPGGKVREWTGRWRSADGGSTWSERAEVKDLIGREQWLTCTKDGTLFAAGHLLAQDVNNPDGYTHSYLHRSADGGRTWQRLRIGPEGFPPRAVTMCSRNLVELPDGSLLLGVGVNEAEKGTIAYLWASRDGGRTWERSGPRVQIGSYGRRPYDNYDAFFTEDFTFQAKSGKLLHFVRCGPPSPMYPMNDGRATPAGDDGIDRMLRCESSDSGKTWGELHDHGDYGMHYPRVLRLHDGRLLLTFTQRAVTYPIGLQAVLSHDEGETWDFRSDRIVIESKTPWGRAQGGGFGNTVQLRDELLVSSYSYRGADDRTHLEVVRWRLPAASGANKKPESGTIPALPAPVFLVAEGLLGECRGDGVDLPGDQVEAGLLGHGARVADGPVNCQPVLLGRVRTQPVERGLPRRGRRGRGRDRGQLGGDPGVQQVVVACGHRTLSHGLADD